MGKVVERGYRDVWLLDWVLWVQWLLSAPSVDEGLLKQLLVVGDGCELVEGLRRQEERYPVREFCYQEGRVWVEWEGRGPNGTSVSSLGELEGLAARFSASGWQLRWAGVDPHVLCVEYAFGGELVGMGLGYARDGVYLSEAAVCRELGVDERVWKRNGWGGVRVVHRWEVVRSGSAGVSEVVLWVHWSCGGDFFGKEVVFRGCRAAQWGGGGCAEVLRGCLLPTWRAFSDGVARLDAIDQELRMVGCCLYGVEVSDDSGNKRLSAWRDRRTLAECFYSEVVVGMGIWKFEGGGFYAEDVVKKSRPLAVFRSVKSWKDYSCIDSAIRGLEEDIHTLYLEMLTC